jgi:hypothetical protein
MHHISTIAAKMRNIYLIFVEIDLIPTAALHRQMALVRHRALASL